MKHYDHQYTIGLNVLNKPFEKVGSCVPGGLYFTIQQYLYNFLDYGDHIHQIFLPYNDPKFEMVLDPQGDKYRANKIIVDEKKYMLDDIETYIILKIKLNKNIIKKFPLTIVIINRIDTYQLFNSIVERLITEKNEELLAYLYTKAKDNNDSLIVSDYFIRGCFFYESSDNEIYIQLMIKYIDLYNLAYYASKYDRVDVLNKIKENTEKFELKYFKFSIDDILSLGNVNILEWWKNMSNEFDYTSWGIDNAHGIIKDPTRLIDLLEWCKSNIELKYTEYALLNLYRNFDYPHIIKVMKWWIRSGLEIKYNENLLTNYILISYNKDYLPVLKWWNESKLEIKYTEDLIDCIHQETDVEKIICVLEWFQETKLPIKYTELSIDNIYIRSRKDDNIIKILDWWLKSGLELKYTNLAIDKFMIVRTKIQSAVFDKRDHYEQYKTCERLIKWWKKSGLQIKCSDIYLKYFN
jgi:hypothetical protein